MNAHRIETKIDRDGMLVLDGIPFQAGDEVEVIIMERQPRASGTDPYPLRGQPIQYDDPFEHVSEDAWNALQ